MSAWTDTNAAEVSSASEREGRIEGFDFVEDGSLAAIRFNEKPILRFEQHHLFAGSQFRALDQCMAPEAGPEIAVLPLFHCLRGRGVGVTEVRYDVLTQSRDRLVLRIAPTATPSGTAPFDEVQEVVELGVHLEAGRFVWTQKQMTTFRRDLPLFHNDAKYKPALYDFHHQDDRPGVFLEFADPQPVGSSGPAVPMRRDWLGQYEPYAGPETFRQAWRRRYTGIIFQNPDGSFARGELNKRQWYHLTRDNRRARPCHRSGVTYIVRDDGWALAYECDAPSHYHHVCEWGIDFHFWCDLEPFSRGGVIPGGTQVACTTTVRLVEPDVAASVSQRAAAIALTAEERERADRPAYEEPANTFAVSALDRLDALAWQPTSEGCAWDRTSGDGADTGCLVIRNRYSREGEWYVAGVGPSQWCNPVIAGARYRLSAWVKLEQFEPDPSDAPGPLLAVEWSHYPGPGSLARGQTISGGQSASLVQRHEPLFTGFDWRRIELVTNPAPPNVLATRLRLRLVGRGTASFSNVQWELVEAGS